MSSGSTARRQAASRPSRVSSMTSAAMRPRHCCAACWRVARRRRRSGTRSWSRSRAISSDTDDTKDAGWLDVTHTLTYVNALRWAWSADPGPAVLRGVLHAAWFVQWTSKFDAAPGPAPVAPYPGSDAGAVLAAIRKRDPDQA